MGAFLKSSNENLAREGLRRAREVARFACRKQAGRVGRLLEREGLLERVTEQPDPA